jgi:hypothetical protein
MPCGIFSFPYRSGIILLNRDLFVYTPEEFERMQPREFVKHVLERGQVFYAK